MIGPDEICFGFRGKKNVSRETPKKPEILRLGNYDGKAMYICGDYRYDSSVSDRLPMPVCFSDSDSERRTQAQTQTVLKNHLNGNNRSSYGNDCYGYVWEYVSIPKNESPAINAAQLESITMSAVGRKVTVRDGPDSAACVRPTDPFSVLDASPPSGEPGWSSEGTGRGGRNDQRGVTSIWQWCESAFLLFLVIVFLVFNHNSPPIT
jgi:hypothetical protein